MSVSSTFFVILVFFHVFVSDEEQMQLYQAALVIQNAFRQYKVRKVTNEGARTIHPKEIQFCYSRGEMGQTILFRPEQNNNWGIPVTCSTLFILQGRQQQKQQELEAAVIIQNYYRRYKQVSDEIKLTLSAVIVPRSTIIVLAWAK